MDLPIQLHCHQGLHFDQSKFKKILNQLPILKILVRKQDKNFRFEQILDIKG